MFANATTYAPLPSAGADWPSGTGLDVSGFSTSEPWYWYEIPSISNNNWKASTFGGTDNRFVVITPDGEGGASWSIVYSNSLKTL